MDKVFKAKQIIAIWAQDQAGLIGANQTMPWHLPAELAHFKKTTMGQAILMGRKTFDGMGRRTLSGREILILTHDKTYQVDGVKTVSSPEEALAWFDQQNKDLYIAGGAGVYQAFINNYTGLVKTIIQARFEGDTYFPEMDMAPYQLVSEENHSKDQKNPYDFTIATYQKLSNQ
ncbi:dihydrofolate reductase [Streptococcus sobrinus]|uniref:dihydrofolate reductase n=2 Tax=Streptococcus sobrinus TaxID=1310 RepID=UPI000D70822B|nr:dihydrofolate reductase [Streptococcus sobrinus]AWN61574.1 dihydrofolate reductase [Streptococcus sobrinus]AWN63446.1 dihydrofolate reductase [Streptococcus sobrinus]SQG19922.1 dihydrofolate reductase [Streptococcus sobrinus]